MSPRRGLDKAGVVQAAADLVNSEGVEALSLSRLAQALGVQTPSLYNHIDGMSGLQRELALLNARQLGDCLGEAAVGKSGSQALRAVAQAFRTYIKENQGVYLSSLRASLKRTPVEAELGKAEARVVEVVLATMAAYDLERDEAIHAVRALRSLVHGFTTLEIAGGFGMPLDVDESFRRLVELLIRGLGPAKQSMQVAVKARHDKGSNMAQPESEQKDQERPSSQDRRVWAKDGKEMVRVPAGEFLYGEDMQKLSLPEFWIDRMPVTNREFSRFFQATGYKTTAERMGMGCAYAGGKWEDVPGANWQHPGGPKTDIQSKADHPVVQVSWEDAQAYARWAGKRLPTEQEWEKASRGTDGRLYPWGNQEPGSDLCNFNRNEGGTTPVGKYSPQGDSPYGCMDMAGNTWEWTASRDEGGGVILRGGGWSHPAAQVRATDRPAHHPDDRYDTDGFRCVESHHPPASGGKMAI